jgi:hypothetical protein
MPNPVSLDSLVSSCVNDMEEVNETRRVTDMDGHKWPITGYLCTICRWPLIPVNNSTTHPNCETENTNAH